jgi:hypothetical protein
LESLADPSAFLLAAVVRNGQILDAPAERLGAGVPKNRLGSTVPVENLALGGLDDSRVQRLRGHQHFEVCIHEPVSDP